MAGNINVVDPCDDGSVFVDFEFFSSGPGQSYDVLNQGNMLINDRTYIPGGIQHFTLELPAQGQSHVIQVTDNGCLLYTSPSPRDRTRSRMPSSA